MKDSILYFWYKYLIWRCKFRIEYLEEKPRSSCWDEEVYIECEKIDELKIKLKNVSKKTILWAGYKFPNEYIKN